MDYPRKRRIIGETLILGSKTFLNSALRDFLSKVCVSEQSQNSEQCQNRVRTSKSSFLTTFSQQEHNMPSSRIVELAAIIQKHTSKVDEYLTSHDLPSPSFDISTPPVLQLPPHIQASQKAIIEADDELSALILGPMRSIDSTPVRCLTTIYPMN